MKALMAINESVKIERNLTYCQINEIPFFSCTLNTMKLIGKSTDIK